MKPTLKLKTPLKLPRRPQRPVSGLEWRSEDYDQWAEYYSKKYHGIPDSEFTPRQIQEKLKLRQWLNDQSNMRRKPRKPEDVQASGIYRHWKG